MNGYCRWGVKLPPKRGKTVVEIMHAIHADEIKGMYVEGENPAMSDPDLNHAREALAHLEHLVVQDPFLTETAVYADVVLPASGWPEKDGTVTNTNRQVQMGRHALQHDPRVWAGDTALSPRFLAPAFNSARRPLDCQVFVD